jgi:hypothetical protein
MLASRAPVTYLTDDRNDADRSASVPQSHMALTHR